MKRYIIYAVILVAGILIGRLVFPSGDSIDTHSHGDAVEASSSWTCSMHPQIVQAEPGDCPICGMELIPADAADGASKNGQFKMTEQALALANVQTIVVSADPETSQNLKLSGSVVKNEDANTVQISYFNGRIESLFVGSTGDAIQQGQLLATIYAPELIAAQQELLTAAKLRDKQPELYKAVRNKLRLWKMTDTQIDAMEASGVVEDAVKVYATVSGTVMEKHVEEGQSVKSGDPLFSIANLNTVWIHFEAYESQIPYLSEGSAITVTMDALPGTELKTTIKRVEPVLKDNTRTVTVRAELNNSDGKLKPGMFAEGIVSLPKTSDQQLTVPQSAVLWTGERSVVYVKTDPDNPVFEMREIQVGAKLGNT